MKVAVCGYRCGFASDELAFCDWCGGAMTIVESRDLTLGESFCRLWVAVMCLWREVSGE